MYSNTLIKYVENCPECVITTGGIGRHQCHVKGPFQIGSNGTPSDTEKQQA